MREIIFDTETTGLDPLNGHKIIEIGAVELINKVITGREFRTYINPQRKNDPEAYAIHGISDDFLLNKPLFVDIAADFIDFIHDAKLVAHNARFDMRFINHELMLINRPVINMEIVIDTLLLARRKFPGARASLDALCDRFTIDRQQRKDGHGALIDAKLLAEVYIQLTGGRQTKFNLINDNVTEKISANLLTQATVDQQIPALLTTTGLLIKPTIDEKTAHEKFLAKIKQPIWQNINS